MILSDTRFLAEHDPKLNHLSHGPEHFFVGHALGALQRGKSGDSRNFTKKSKTKSTVLPRDMLKISITLGSAKKLALQAKKY